MSFPCSEKSLSIPGFPGLWPPCQNAEFCVKIKKKSGSSINGLLREGLPNRQYCVCSAATIEDQYWPASDDEGTRRAVDVERGNECERDAGGDGISCHRWTQRPTSWLELLQHVTHLPHLLYLAHCHTTHLSVYASTDWLACLTSAYTRHHISTMLSSCRQTTRRYGYWKWQSVKFSCQSASAMVKRCKRSCTMGVVY